MGQEVRLGIAGVATGARGVIEMLPRVPGYRVAAAADVRSQPLDDLRLGHLRQHDPERDERRGDELPAVGPGVWEESTQ